MEDPDQIFDYLPISRTELENDYIVHLWQAFILLEQSNGVERGFALMPFHLLFILSIQYRLLRIASEKATLYKKAFENIVIRDKNDKSKIVNPQSVFDLALMNESYMIDVFKLLSIHQDVIDKFKWLIVYRNESMAHAKGNTGLGMDEKIDEYLEVLRLIQPYIKPMNDMVANSWLSEITDEDDPFEFTQLRLGPAYLCGADFKSGLLEKNQGKFFGGME